MGGWSRVDENVLDRALALARGCYQRNVILGFEAISGSTLAGKARRYSARYHLSRRNLMTRLRKAGLAVGEERGEHNRRILIIAVTP